MAPIPKVKKRPRAKISEQRYRQQVRLEVIARAERTPASKASGQPMCECCGLAVGTEMHEGRFRSQTRNLSPEKRFATAWCMWLDAGCHRDIQEHRVEIYCASAILGLNGRCYAFRPHPPAGFRGYTLIEVWRAITGSTD